MAISGFLILYVIVMMLYRMNEEDNQNKNYHNHMLLLTLAVAIGIHGLHHAYAEVNFKFNPLTNNFRYRLDDKRLKRCNQANKSS